MVVSQKLNLSNYGNGWHFLKEQDEKCSLSKNQPVGVNWWGDISNVILQRLHIYYPSKISLDRKCYACPSFLLFEELV